MLTKDEKLAQLKLTLDEKIKRTKELILEWYLQYNGQVYVAYSGGKDSTVLLHIARSIKTCADIPAVFVDTGLEYPEIREHVKNTENVVWVKPKYTFKQVLEKYGYPIISKEQSRYLYDMRHSKSEKLKDVRLNGRLLANGKRGKMSTLSRKWRPLIDADFEISNKCCDVMKKNPSKQYSKESGKKPIVGTMAVESKLRWNRYLIGNCNAFSDKHPESKPLSFWTEQDILEYILRFNLKIPSVYGDIVRGDDGLLRTTKCQRTGCMFCMYGLHLEAHPNRFEIMKETHPKQYAYCMDKLGLRHVIEEYGKAAGKELIKDDACRQDQKGIYKEENDGQLSLF